MPTTLCGRISAGFWFGFDSSELKLKVQLMPFGGALSLNDRVVQTNAGATVSDTVSQGVLGELSSTCLQQSLSTACHALPISLPTPTDISLDHYPNKNDLHFNPYLSFSFPKNTDFKTKPIFDWLKFWWRTTTPSPIF